ncbi:hypothetical protein DYD21_04145 [Rhodohalobacter sp. SW132]|uniref:hypothetical protein n=1 Tax=Rhodohalobacter sp. SW132 TaxID=2293433 RepID=UPI000E24680E|nr:hypothetical protein [Rhodohalobacter sp. SW132]REL39155.1 hypothetical protein DYD21_04145 [Rhodohalobacter sp. SW132]
MFNSILKALNRKKVDSIKRYAMARGVPKSTLDDTSVMQLMRYPEATVITILDKFKSLVSEGINEKDAISKIESMRSKANSGFGITPTEISDFVIYRIKVEHSNSNSLLSEEVEHLKEITNHYLNI